MMAIAYYAYSLIICIYLENVNSPELQDNCMGNAVGPPFWEVVYYVTLTQSSMQE